MSRLGARIRREKTDDAQEPVRRRADHQGVEGASGRYPGSSLADLRPLNVNETPQRHPAFDNPAQ